MIVEAGEERAKIRLAIDVTEVLPAIFRLSGWGRSERPLPRDQMLNRFRFFPVGKPIYMNIQRMPLFLPPISRRIARPIRGESITVEMSRGSRFTTVKTRGHLQLSRMTVGSRPAGSSMEVSIGTRNFL